MEKDTRANRYLPETRERAVRMVLANEGGHADRAAAIRAIAPKIGCSRESLRRWVIQAEIDGGARDGMTREERDRIKALERENRELRQANEILRKASAYFAQAELDRPFRRRSRSSMIIALSTGSSRSAGFCRSPRRRITPISPPVVTPRGPAHGRVGTPG